VKPVVPELLEKRMPLNRLTASHDRPRFVRRYLPRQRPPANCRRQALTNFRRSQSSRPSAFPSYVGGFRRIGRNVVNGKAQGVAISAQHGIRRRSVGRRREGSSGTSRSG